MEITCLKENFKKSLNLLERAITNKPTLPILRNILLKNDNGKINLIATDLEIAVKSWFRAKIEGEDKEITLPFSILNSILFNIPDEKINLKISEKNMTIISQNLKTKIQGIPVDDFPIIPRVKKEKSIKIDAQILKEAFNSVSYISSLSSLKPEISGVLFFLNKDEIEIVSTDSFRLGRKIINANYFKTSLKEEKVKLIIPLKTVQEYVKIVENLNLNTFIDFYFEENQILFDFPDVQLISRLIDGNFPEYEAVIPKKFDAEVVVKKDELIQFIKLASVFTSRTKDLKFIIPENLKNLEIYSQDINLGENKSYLEGRIKGGKVEITFNYQFVLDGLKPIKNEEVFIGFNQNNSPSLIKDEEDPSYLYIVMPLKM